MNKIIIINKLPYSTRPPKAIATQVETARKEKKKLDHHTVKMLGKQQQIDGN